MTHPLITPTRLDELCACYRRDDPDQGRARYREWCPEIDAGITLEAALALETVPLEDRVWLAIRHMRTFGRAARAAAYADWAAARAAEADDAEWRRQLDRAMHFLRTDQKNDSDPTTRDD